MKNHIRGMHRFNMELVPPGCHIRNAAEVAIRNFKAHFLSILTGVSDDFPPSLWDQLLPQTKIIINLIQQSNATPNVSAYAHLSGPFNYNKMPLTPMGCNVQVHEKTGKRGTWAFHLVDGGQHCLQSPINQTGHQMDARPMWIPGKIDVAQGHKGGQLRGLANI